MPDKYPLSPLLALLKSALAKLDPVSALQNATVAASIATGRADTWHPSRPASATVTDDQLYADDLRAKVFRDRERVEDWRVEKMDEDGGYECVEIFAGPNARQRAIDYARHRFGDFDEIELGLYAD